MKRPDVHASAATSNLRQRFAHSAKWTLTSSLFVKVTSVVTTLILARILSPWEFGLFALAFVVIDGLGLFKSLGVESALIQRTVDLEIAADTAFYIIPTLGFIVYLALVLSSRFVASAFHSAELAGVLRVLGLLFIVNTFSRVPLSLLQQRLQFDASSRAEIISQITNSVTSLALALLGFGVWSLVIGYLTSTFIYNIIVWYSAKWMPRFRFDRRVALEMLHYGKYIFVGSLLFFLYRNLDRLVVARIVSIEALGIYALAFNLSTLITEYVGSRVGDVLFPVFARLQGDHSRLREVYLSALKGLLLVSLPFSIALFFLGGDALRLLFGTKWLAATPVLRILAPLSIPMIVSASASSLLLGIKQPRSNLLSQSLRILIYAVLIVPLGTHYGVNGIASLVLFAAVVSTGYALFIVNKAIQLTWKSIFRFTYNLLCAAMLMSLTLWGLLSAHFIPLLPTSIRFLMQGVIAMSVYVCFILLTERSFINSLAAMFLTGGSHKSRNICLDQSISGLE